MASREFAGSAESLAVCQQLQQDSANVLEFVICADVPCELIRR